MSRANTESEARERILETARDLFYRNGYRATGINEIIRKSAVAKATFYAHFPSKEDLAVAYVQAQNELDAETLAEHLGPLSGPHAKLMGLFAYIETWSRERQYRGCSYLNIASEVPDPSHPVRRETKSHYTSVRTFLGRLISELKQERGAAWKGRDADQLADALMLLVAGALAMGQIYHDPAPFRQAAEAARKLLK